LKTIVVTSKDFSVLVKTNDENLLFEDCELLSLKKGDELITPFSLKEITISRPKQEQLEILLKKNPKIQLLINKFELE
jgi:hypothetical protein